MNISNAHADWADELSEVVGRLLILARDKRAPKRWASAAEKVAQHGIRLMQLTDDTMLFETVSSTITIRPVLAALDIIPERVTH